MRSTKAIKIYTLLAHFFILVGMGHGIAPIGIIEIMSLLSIHKAAFSFSFKAPFNDPLYSMALTSLLGQICLLVSFFLKKDVAKIILHLVGLLFLWLSVYFIIQDSTTPDGVHFSMTFAIPFMICTLFPFYPIITAPLKSWNKWMDT